MKALLHEEKSKTLHEILLLFTQVKMIVNCPDSANVLRVLKDCFHLFPSTCVKYSKPSEGRGTRFALVNEVALGQCKEVFEFDQSLVSPPEGYQSVHGVRKNDDIVSNFEDDEYVIYDPVQQRVR